MDPKRARRRLTSEQRADLVCVSIFAALPIIVFGLAAGSGHPILTGDNLIQNFPLRVLAGQQISKGHLPVWNQYIWSGTPLLGGFNAGALYPFTFLFAVIGANGAWALNEIAVYLVSALGFYSLCRSYRIRPIASFLATIAFAYLGAMSAQLVHIGLVQGMSWVPWSVLAVKKLAETRLPSSRLKLPRPFVGWTCVFIFTNAMILMAGEPRAISNAVVIELIFSAWVIWKMPGNPQGETADPSSQIDQQSDRVRRRAQTFAMNAGTRLATWAVSSLRFRLALILVAGAIWAGLIGAVQLLPGLQFLQDSQRASGTYQNFASGSLPLGWSALMAVPDLLGGSGSFGQPRFLDGFQLSEVTGYVGLLPLIAVFALLVHSRSLASRARLLRGQWGVWYLVGAAGLILSWGSTTFLGRLLWHIPLYGGQRLQSRNLAILDFAVAIVFAFWMDDALVPVAKRVIDIPAIEEVEADNEFERRALLRSRREAIQEAREASQDDKWIFSLTAKLMSAFPAIAGAILAALAIVWGPSFARQFTSGKPSILVAHYRNMIPSLVVALVLCAGAASLAFIYRSIPHRLRAAVLTCFFLVDSCAFVVTTLVEFSSPAIASAKSLVNDSISLPGPSSASSPNQTFGSHGEQAGMSNQLPSLNRYAIYDPNLDNQYGLTHVGQPDLNVLRNSLSVAGYGSI
ncbi:MAG TPA: hypothetical protein VMU77_02650, partial [Acidimicrobiales bacterium]|nr:hypothetical protein [Acidimicrobiales bacterium]